MTTASLVEVHCSNLRCPYLMKKGRRLVIGHLSGRGKLYCGSCRAWDFYEA